MFDNELFWEAALDEMCKEAGLIQKGIKYVTAPLRKARLQSKMVSRAGKIGKKISGYGGVANFSPAAQKASGLAQSQLRGMASRAKKIGVGGSSMAENISKSFNKAL